MNTETSGNTCAGSNTLGGNGNENAVCRGPLDGQWVEVPEGTHHYQAWGKGKENLNLSYGQYYENNFTVVRYKRMHWSSIYGKRSLFGLETMNEMDVMDILMKGYKNNTNKPKAEQQ